MAHTHSVIDDDLRFIIDPSTREIGNGSQKVKLMQYDHNSERFTFEIPRFVEGHDMSLCNSIRLNYININKSTGEQNPGVYEVSDTKVEEGNIIFSWLVSLNATQYAGPLNFLIKFICFDEDDYITYEWHTDIFKSASVYTGMNIEESIDEVYPDILEKWKNDVLAAEASRINAESERVAAETKRVSAESERETAESKRATSESERVNAESERVNAESERETAESKRVNAESERANTFAGYETEINQLKGDLADTESKISAKMKLIEPVNQWGKNTVTDGYVDLTGTVHEATSLYHMALDVTAGDVLRNLNWSEEQNKYNTYSMRFLTTYDSNGVVDQSKGAENVNNWTVPEGISNVVVTISKKNSTSMSDDKFVRRPRRTCVVL